MRWPDIHARPKMLGPVKSELHFVCANVNCNRFRLLEQHSASCRHTVKQIAQRSTLQARMNYLYDCMRVALLGCGAHRTIQWGV